MLLLIAGNETTTNLMSNSLNFLATRPDIYAQLQADPARIEPQLAIDAALRERVARRPGLRVPGAFDGFELLARAILGHQVSVSAEIGRAHV